MIAKKLKPTLAEALPAVVAMLAEHDKAVGSYFEDPQGWHARHRHQCDLLGRRLAEELGAHVRDRWDGAAVTIAGIRSSSSTSSLAGALRSWKRAAEARLGGGA